MKRHLALKSAATVSSLWVALGCSLLVGVTVYAADPAGWNDPGWWSSQGAVTNQVVTTNGGVVSTNYALNNSAVANQGQLKKFTVAAYRELQADLSNSGGAGRDLSNLVYDWQQDYATNGYATNTANPTRPFKAGDFAAVNVGQLKYVASLVYGRLYDAGYTGLYPSWIGQNTNTDSAAASIGQVKTVFNFNVTATPNAPSNLIATVSANPLEIDLSWTPPAVNNANSYTLLYSTDGGTTWNTLTSNGDPTQTSYAATDLDPTQSYQFELTYDNSNATGGGSSSSTPATTSQPTPPKPPPRFAVIDLGAGKYADSINNAGYVSLNDATSLYRWHNGSMQSFNLPPLGVIGGGPIDEVGTLLNFQDSDPYKPVVYLDNSSTPIPINLSSQGPVSTADVGLYWTAIDSVNGKIYGFGYENSITVYFSYGAQWPSYGGNESILGDASYYINEDGAPVQTGSSEVIIMAKNDATRGLMRVLNHLGDEVDGGYTLNHLSIDFLPYALNSDGWALGDNGTGNFLYDHGIPETIPGNLALYSFNSQFRNLNNPDGTVTPIECPQVIGVDSNFNLVLYQENPNTGSYESFKLDDLMGVSSGWSGFSRGGPDCINDSGAIVGTATYSGSNTNIATGSHGVLLLPVSISPSTIPTSGVARAKLVFGSGVQVPTIDPTSSQVDIKIGGVEVADIHQDDNDPHIFYFMVPAGTAGPADVTITGIQIPGMPWLSATPPQTMTLPSLVQYTDDSVQGTKGFSDANVVAIDEDKSTLDYLIQQGTITSSQAFDTFAEMRDTDTQTAEPFIDEFFSSVTPDDGALDTFTQNANNELSVVYATYPPPLGGGGSTSGGVVITASTPDAYEAGPNSGLFTVSRPTASTSSLTVNYTVGGTATNGTDYTTLSGSVVIAANQTSAQIVVAPIQHALGANKTVVLTLSTSSSYAIDSAYNAATVTIYDYGNGITSNTPSKKNTRLVALNRAPRPAVDQLFLSHFFVGNGTRHMSVNPSALAMLMIGQIPPPPLPPQLGSSTFFTDVQSRLAATGSKMYCGTLYLANTTGFPLESGRSSVPINYFVFSADSYHLTVYPATAVGHIIDNAVADNPSASLIINGAQCNFHCPSRWKRIQSWFPGQPAAATSNPEPFQTIGVVIHGGSVLSPTSSTATKGGGKGSWQTALERYWFGQSTAANSGQALSYQFGQGNPTASATPEGLGGLTGLIYPSGVPLVPGPNAKDLKVYSPLNLGGDLPGFNVIGVDRDTGMVIVVTKNHEEKGSLFDVQALLHASGVDLAEITDGGGSVGCWSKTTSYVSKGERQKGTPDDHNTVTTYLIFTPNP